MRVILALIFVVSTSLRPAFAGDRSSNSQSNNGPSHDEETREFDVNSDSEHLYSNTWAVHVEGGEAKAKDIAGKHGFNFVVPIGSLKDHYLFEHSAVEARRRRRSVEHHNLLENEPSVQWLEQQKILKRSKRGFQDFSDPLFGEQWYLKNKGMQFLFWKLSMQADEMNRLWVLCLLCCVCAIGHS